MFGKPIAPGFGMAPLVALVIFRRPRAVHHRRDGRFSSCLSGICTGLRSCARPVDDAARFISGSLRRGRGAAAFSSRGRRVLLLALLILRNRSGHSAWAVIPVLRNRVAAGYDSELWRMSLGMVAFVLLGWMFGHLAFLANGPNAYGYLCFVIFATEVNDVAAFTFGKMFGRHPLRSEISPRKTWEGALGGLAVALALPWLLRFSFPFFGTWQLILAGLIVGVGGPLGDLSLSVIKRDLGAKDWGASIPGHGGVLDRIDSLIFVVAAVHAHDGILLSRPMSRMANGAALTLERMAVDRLRRFPREPDLLVYGFRSRYCAAHPRLAARLSSVRNHRRGEFA